MREAVEPPIESINDVEVLKRLLLEARAEERIADYPIRRIDELLPWNIGRQPERLTA